MSTEDPRAAVYEIAYEQAIRGIDQQIEDLKNLRGRVGLLITVAGATAALLSGIAFPSPVGERVRFAASRR